MVKNMHICIIIMIMPLSYANLKQSLYYSIFFYCILYYRNVKLIRINCRNALH